MDRQAVINRLEKAMDTLRLLPDEMRKLDYKSGYPEIVREWLSYGSEGEALKFIASARIRPSPEEISEMMEVAYWIRYAASLRGFNGEPCRVVMAIIYLHSCGKGFRRVRDELIVKMGKRYGHTTCKLWYDQAVDAISQKF